MTGRRARIRQRAGAAVVDGFFRTASRLGRLHPGSRPSVHGVEVWRDLPYGAHPLHRVDVYRPVADAHPRARTGVFAPPLPPPRTPPAGPPPGVLYLHGGGFRILSKDSHWLAGLLFARHGYVVANASYRLAPAAPFPAAIQDACAAWLWLVDHARGLGVDPGRLVVAGESAGANLALALAVCATVRLEEPWARAVYDRGVVPRVVLPAAGMLQVSAPERLWSRKPLPAWLRDRIAEVAQAYLPDGAASALADPLTLLESEHALDRPFPPTWAAVGTADPLLDDTRRLAHALARRDVPHQVSYWPGGFHAFHMFVFRSDARAVWAEMFAFADRYV